jgi:pantetheine-phosphate adenylyltransferase
MTTAAIYPGSFDPITNGHVDIVRRGLGMFDRVIFAVLNNPAKSGMFSVEERLDLARESLAGLDGVEFDSFQGLLVDYAKTKGVNVMLRGLRAVSDFDYEFQLASMNRKLSNNAVETVFMVTGEDYFYVSSSLIRDIARFDGDVTQFVPAPVAAALADKLKG